MWILLICISSWKGYLFSLENIFIIVEKSETKIFCILTFSFFISFRIVPTLEKKKTVKQILPIVTIESKMNLWSFSMNCTYNFDSFPVF